MPARPKTNRDYVVDAKQFLEKAHAALAKIDLRSRKKDDQKFISMVRDLRLEVTHSSELASDAIREAMPTQASRAC